MSRSDHLTLALEEDDEDTLQQLQDHSITYLIAMVALAGRKVLTLRTIPAREEEKYGTDQLGRIGSINVACWGGGEYATAQEAGMYLPVYLPSCIIARSVWS